MTLPDCTLCGGPVVVEPDGDRGPVEACQDCGTAQRVLPVRVDRPAIRQAVRESRVRRLIGPSCLGRRHTRCTASGCECTCHDETKGGRGAPPEHPAQP